MKGGGINDSIYYIAYYISYHNGIDRVGRKCFRGDRYCTVRGCDCMCDIHNMGYEKAAEKKKVRETRLDRG